MVRAGLAGTEWRCPDAWLAQRRAGGQRPGDHMCSPEGVCQQQAQPAESSGLQNFSKSLSSTKTLLKSQSLEHWEPSWCLLTPRPPTTTKST